MTRKQIIQIISPVITDMNIKICLALFGAIIALAVCTPDERTLINSLSEEVVSESHVIRTARALGKKKEISKQEKQ